MIHFGYDAMPNRMEIAGNLGESQWERLQRPSKQAVKTKQRTRPPRVKEQIVVDCEFNNNVLNSEDGAEFDYRPTACRPNYRTIVVRKNLSVEKGENILSTTSGICSTSPTIMTPRKKKPCFRATIAAIRKTSSNSSQMAPVRSGHRRTTCIRTGCTC